MQCVTLCSANYADRPRNGRTTSQESRCQNRNNFTVEFFTPPVHVVLCISRIQPQPNCRPTLLIFVGISCTPIRPQLNLPMTDFHKTSTNISLTNLQMVVIHRYTILPAGGHRQIPKAPAFQHVKLLVVSRATSPSEAAAMAMTVIKQ